MKQSATKPYHVSAFEIVSNFEKLQTQIDRARKASVDFDLDLDYPSNPRSDKTLGLTLDNRCHSFQPGVSQDLDIEEEIEDVILSVELDILEEYI